MGRLRHIISSPSALLSFEAAARCLNFTKAAQELNVSQAAVSTAIKSLETNLGIALFYREHNRVLLTEVGKRLFSDVSMGLGHIARSLEAVKRASEDRHVTLSTSTAFASHWIIPRLPAFRSLNPSIDLRLQTSDRDIDISAENITLGIRRGLGNWDQYDSVHFADETLFAVCSPGYLRATGRVSGLADLAGRKLIHLEEPHRPRPTWTDWFGAHGLDFVDDGEGLRLNDYGLVIQAAVGSQGIALGWSHIVDHPIKQGLLVRASPEAWSTGSRFYVVQPKSISVSPAALTVRDWMLDEAGDLRKMRVQAQKIDAT